MLSAGKNVGYKSVPGNRQNKAVMENKFAKTKGQDALPAVPRFFKVFALCCKDLSLLLHNLKGSKIKYAFRHYKIQRIGSMELSQACRHLCPGL